jgi:hypothetical protein
MCHRLQSVPTERGRMQHRLEAHRRIATVPALQLRHQQTAHGLVQCGNKQTGKMGQTEVRNFGGGGVLTARRPAVGTRVGIAMLDGVACPAHASATPLSPREGTGHCF